MNFQSFPSKLGAGFGAAYKAFRMQFSGANPAGGWTTGGILPIDDAIVLAQTVRRFFSDINYAREIGDLTNSSLVMAAVSWVGRTLPEAQIRVVEPNKRGKNEAVANHPLITRLQRPNPYYSGSTLWKASALSWILSGNIYWHKRRNIRDGIAEIYWWPHWMIRPVRATKNDFITFYEVNVDGIWIQLSEKDSRNIIHFRDGMDPHNDMVGLSPLAALQREIYADNRTADYRAAVMKNGGAIPYALAPKDPNLDVDIEELKKEALRKTTGDDVGKPLVLSAAVELLRLAITPRDMLIDEFAKVPEERMAAVIGIPGLVLGYGAAWARSTFSNYEQAAEAAYETYMVPLWKYLDDELTLQLLLRDYEDSESLRKVDHDLSTVRALQEDEDAKHKRVGMDFQNGFITRAEARAETGYEVDAERDEVFLLRAGVTVVPADAETVKMESDARRANLEAQVERQRMLATAPAQQQPPNNQPPQENEEASNRPPRRQLAAASLQFPSQYIKGSGWHDFSTVQINLPEALADRMHTLGAMIPDIDLEWHGREGEPHITVKYGLHTDNADEVRSVLQQRSTVHRSFEITLGKTAYFSGPDFDVVYVEVLNDGTAPLSQLHSLLSENLANTTTHDGYTPHVTVAFVKPGLGSLYAGNALLDGLKFEADSLVFSAPSGERSIIRLDQESATILQYVNDGAKAASEYIADEGDTVKWLMSVLPADAQGLATPQSLE